MIRRILEAIAEVELEPTDPFRKKGEKLSVLEAMRQALLEVLGPTIAAHVGAYPSAESDEWDVEKVRAVIAKATFEGDPHKWCVIGGEASNNLMVVYHESGVPGPNDAPGKWSKVDERAGELCGRPLISEPYNAAVTCVYEDK